MAIQEDRCIGIDAQSFKTTVEYLFRNLTQEHWALHKAKGVNQRDRASRVKAKKWRVKYEWEVEDIWFLLLHWKCSFKIPCSPFKQTKEIDKRIVKKGCASICALSHPEILPYRHKPARHLWIRQWQEFVLYRWELPGGSKTTWRLGLRWSWHPIQMLSFRPWRVDPFQQEGLWRKGLNWLAHNTTLVLTKAGFSNMRKSWD